MKSAIIRLVSYPIDHLPNTVSFNYHAKTQQLLCITERGYTSYMSPMMKEKQWDDVVFINGIITEINETIISDLIIHGKSLFEFSHDYNDIRSTLAALLHPVELDELFPNITLSDCGYNIKIITDSIWPSKRFPFESPIHERVAIVDDPNPQVTSEQIFRKRTR